MTLMRLEVDANGAPREPASRGLWSRVFSGPELPDDGARQMRNAEDDPIDAAWLVASIGSADVRLRSERLDQIAFGQRVFGAAGANERGDVLVALRAMSRYRMLMWTLERMGVKTPAVYASAARQAARIGVIEGRRGFDVQAQFQGALALVARMTAVRTIDVKAAQKLVEQIIAVPVNDSGEYAGAHGAMAARRARPGDPSCGDQRACRHRRDVGPAVRRRRGRPAGDVGGTDLPPRSRRPPSVSASRRSVRSRRARRSTWRSSSASPGARWRPTRSRSTTRWRWRRA